MNTSNTASVLKKCQHTLFGAMALLTLFATPSAMAYDPANPLGLSAGLNLLAFDNFSVPSSDVEGRVAIGGNANISGYSINTKNGYNALYSGTGLTVAGNLNFTSGNILGNTIVGGNLLSSSAGSFSGNLQVMGDIEAGNQWLNAKSIAYGGKATGLSTYQESTALKAPAGSIQLGIDFASERARTTDLSQTFDALANTGSVRNSWGTLTLNANAADLAVFDISSAELAGNLSLEGLTANTTVLINVHGQSVDFGAHSYGNFASSRVLFNLPEAKQVTFGAYVNASFLAPLANFTTSGGTINGQVIVANWSGPTQINDMVFRGSIAAVPEPETYAMMLAGLVAVSFAAKLRRKSQVKIA
jgi:choice-of-anchor A domain-containing protein